MKHKTNKHKIIIEYFKNNSKEIFTMSIVFLIGLIIGIMMINNIKEERPKRNN